MILRDILENVRNIWQPFDFIVDPSKRDILKILNMSRRLRPGIDMHSVRGVLTMDVTSGTLYVWDGYDATHVSGLSLVNGAEKEQGLVVAEQDEIYFLTWRMIGGKLVLFHENDIPEEYFTEIPLNGTYDRTDTDDIR